MAERNADAAEEGGDDEVEVTGTVKRGKNWTPEEYTVSFFVFECISLRVWRIIFHDS